MVGGRCTEESGDCCGRWRQDNEGVWPARRSIVSLFFVPPPHPPPWLMVVARRRAATVAAGGDETTNGGRPARRRLCGDGNARSWVVHCTR